MFDDLRFALRRLRHAPGFTAVAVLTLALAVGANTAILGIADAVLFRPLPYDAPDRIHILQGMNRQTGEREAMMEYPALKIIDEHHQGLSGVGMIGPGDSLILDGPDGAESVPVLRVTPNYFQLLGAKAARGRLFVDGEEPATGRAAILSHEFWQQRFGGDDAVVGRPLTIGTATFDVVGILPPSFVYPSMFVSRAAVVTLMPALARTAEGGTLSPIVRREPGVTREQAQSELDGLMASIVAAKPGNAYPTLYDVRPVLYPTGRPIMILLLCAAGLILLIGCANLASMLLSRTEQREKEMGIRTALGATRLRLVRTLMFEALTIGLASGALSVVVTSLTFDGLLRQVPPVAYRGAPVGMDVRVVVFAIALGLLGGAIFAIVPAWRSAKLDAQYLLQRRSQSGRRRGSVLQPLVAIQVALAIVLVSGAVFAGRAFLSVLRVPLGFSPEDVITISVAPRGVRGHERLNLYARALDSLRQRDDVIAVGAAGSMPLDGRAPDEAVEVDGARQRLAGIAHVLPGYFETVGIPLVRGRFPNWGDVSSGADVAVLSESASRVLFPNHDALGSTVSNGRGRHSRVVGIVSDVRKRIDGESPHPVYVVPRESSSPMTLVVRARSHSHRTLAEIKREVAGLAPRTPVTALWWIDSISALTAYRNPRFQTLVLGSFAALALVLTAVGIFGVVAFLVAMRTREMGIRMAMGATARSLVGLMIRQTVTPVIAGAIAGLIATRWASRLAEAQLFAMDTRDPVTLAAAVATVLAAALLAAYLPARRASRVDPVVVLRAE